MNERVQSDLEKQKALLNQAKAEGKKLESSAVMWSYPEVFF
jgi:hypothetical protein